MDHIELLKDVIPRLLHCHELGIEVSEIEDSKLVLLLPYSAKIIGNPENGNIHGGALTTLLDTCCGFVVLTLVKEPALFPTLDLRIDYMRQAHPEKNIYAEGEVFRVTNNVVFTRAIAHQGDHTKPLAIATGTFMKVPVDSVSNFTTTAEKFMAPARMQNDSGIDNV